MTRALAALRGYLAAEWHAHRVLWATFLDAVLGEPSGRHRPVDPPRVVGARDAEVRAGATTPAPRAADHAGQAEAPAAVFPWQPEEAAHAPARPVLPAPAPSQGPPGRGEHPYGDWPAYGIGQFPLGDGVAVVDGSGAFAAITAPAPPSLRQTGELEALALPAVAKWATGPDVLARLLEALVTA